MGKARMVPEHFAPGGRPKLPFDTRADVFAWLRDHNMRGEAYQCPRCGKWHMGHTRKLPRRVIAAREARARAKAARRAANEAGRQHALEVAARVDAERRARRELLAEARRAWWWQEVAT